MTDSGSIGSELSRQVAKNNPKKLVLFDIGYHYLVRTNSLTSALSNRMDSYERLNNEVLNDLPCSDGLVYRKIKTFIDECRIVALQKTYKDNRRLVSRNIIYIRNNRSRVWDFLDSGQRKRIKLLSFSFSVFRIVELAHNRKNRVF